MGQQLIIWIGYALADFANWQRNPQPLTNAQRKLLRNLDIGRGNAVVVTGANDNELRLHAIRDSDNRLVGYGIITHISEFTGTIEAGDINFENANRICDHIWDEMRELFESKISPRVHLTVTPWRPTD